MADQHFTFTLAKLKALEPEPKTYTVRDDKNPALSARVSPGGIVTLQVRRRPKGSHKVVTVSVSKLSDGIPMSKVYERVVRIVQDLNEGINPNEQHRQDVADQEVASRTLQGIYDEYRQRLNPRTKKPLSENTLRTYDIVLSRDLKDWSNQPMIDITQKMMLERYKQIVEEYGPGSARRMATLTGACWAYANAMADSDEEPYGNPPLRLLNKIFPGWRKAGSRTRKIGMDELPEWLSAVRDEGGMGGAYLEVLLLTGVRRRELSGLKWADVNLQRRTMILRQTKNGSDHTLPISDRVLEILKWSKRKYPDATGPIPLKDPRTIITYVTKASGIEFSCHDLRRTFTTLADRSGSGMYVVKGILNHAAGSDVTAGHYAQYDVSDLREPLQAIENFILSKAKAHRDNVLQVVK